ncbi:DUF2716 domain-containing protein [Micromonospora palomenae]
MWLDRRGRLREDLAVTTPVTGWQHLNRAEYDQVWDGFDERFQFRASMDASQWPAIIEPVPSLTWDLAISRHDFDERWRSGLWRFAVDEDGLNRLVMGALQDCVADDDWVYVLDWQHPAYRCWPHRVDPDSRTDMWPVEVFPNGDYYIFASRDLRFGTFGHPWEATLCIWGADLINAVAARNAGVLTRLYRRDGKPVDRS